MNENDPFLGSWRLLPEQSAYDVGEPPASGTYTIQAHGDSYLISMAWETAAGEQHEMSYTSIPDGVDYPYEDPEIAETVSMTRVDARTLDSAVKKGGLVTAHARRTLSEDGQTMMVVQSGPLADGSSFHNRSVYRRVPTGV